MCSAFRAESHTACLLAQLPVTVKMIKYHAAGCLWVFFFFSYEIVKRCSSASVLRDPDGPRCAYYLISLDIFVLPDTLRTDAKATVKMLTMLLVQHCPTRKLQLGAWNLGASHYFQHFPSAWISACWLAAQHEKMNNLLGMRPWYFCFI